MKKAMLMLLALWLCQWSLEGQTPILITGNVMDSVTKEPLVFATVYLPASSNGTETDLDGYYQLEVPDTNAIIEFSYVGYETKRIRVSNHKNVNAYLTVGDFALEEIVVTEYKNPLINLDQTTSGTIINSDKLKNLPNKSVNAIAATTAGKQNNGIHVRGSRKEANTYYVDAVRTHNFNGETYELPNENTFVSVQTESLSTFSIDVDRAAYSNVRRYIENGQLPPDDAVRIEEMINYFEYEYDEPSGADPFHISQELTNCPWNEKHQVFRIALNTKSLNKDELGVSNLVFLIDVSGSMNSYNKLPLVISSLKILINQMSSDDKITIVTYAGAAGCVLPCTPVSEKKKIFNALERLRAGGSTAGGEGIELAYNLAKESFIPGGNNRVILATDGDFNVGINNPDGLEKLIAKKRKENIFLSVLGFGMGNYRSDMAQRLATKGNGNHAYIDNIHEARKILVREYTASMFAVAKDVKIQIEFNPAFVQSYRLIGYENRMLEKEDFNDDTKDAGEVGIGHSITAIYEIIPAGVDSEFSNRVDDLVFQENEEKDQIKDDKNLALIKIRYKNIESDRSIKIQKLVLAKPVDLSKAENSTRFALAVAQYGLILRDSPFLKTKDYNALLDLADSAISDDPEGEKQEFLKIVKSTMQLDDRIAAK